MVAKRSLEDTLQHLKQRFLMHRWPILAAGATVVLMFVAGLWALQAGLRGRGELRTLSGMPQASTLYDVHNRPVFTTFWEYRIELPLARVSPHLRKAIVSCEHQPFHGHGSSALVRIPGA